MTKTTVETSKTRWLKRWWWKLSKDNQPSPEAKKAGWERRKHAQQILDDILKKQDYTIDKFLKDFMDMKEKKNKEWEIVKTRYEPKTSLTIQEAYNVWYVYSQIVKWWLDWMNRHISFAPQKTELSWEDWWPVEMVWKGW